MWNAGHDNSSWENIIESVGAFSSSTYFLLNFLITVLLIYEGHKEFIG